MFQITKYLQYKNTPNSKPRVLVEGVDYNTICDKFIIDVTLAENLEDKSFYFIGKTNIIANLSDCRPLLSENISGFTEGDIIWSYYIGENGILFFEDDYKLSVKTEYSVEGYYELGNSGYKLFKEESFFDNPKKWSKEIWNCSEEEGWKRVFELLGIKI